MAVTIDIDELIDEFGEFYEDKGQSVKDLRKKILVQGESNELFTPVVTTDTIIRGADIEIGSVLQAYQDTYTPMGNITMTPNDIILKPIKIDWEKNPSSLVNSWAGFLAGKDIDRAAWPLIRYIIEELILPKAAEDWELNAVFSGAISAITAGTAKPVSGAIDGIKKQLNNYITAGDTTPIAVGAMPTDPEDLVDYVEAFVAGIPHEIRPYLQQIAMGTSNFELFQRGMDLKYNTNYASTADITKVKYTNLQVKGYRSHEGSTKIWTTIRGNAILATKNPDNENVFKIESAKRMVSLLSDWWKGIGFYQPYYIYTNDVELT